MVGAEYILGVGAFALFAAGHAVARLVDRRRRHRRRANKQFMAGYRAAVRHLRSC